MPPFNELDCRHGLFPDYLPGVQRNIRKEKKKNASAVERREWISWGDIVEPDGNGRKNVRKRNADQ